MTQNSEGKTCNPWLAECMFFDAYVLIWSSVLAITAYTGAGSAYIPFIWLFFPLVVRETVWKYIKVYKQEGKYCYFLCGSCFMQPSMANLNSPSSRVVKDSTLFRRWILRCINFGNGESSPNQFLDVVNLYLTKFKERWILEQMCFLFFYYFVYFKVNLDLKWINQLDKSSLNFIFAVVNLDPIVLENRWTAGESWPDDFIEKVNRGEDLRWVGSRCPLTHVLG